MTIKMLKEFSECVTGRFDPDKIPYRVKVDLINISRQIGKKIRISSHVRTPEQNRLCGGSLMSSHLTGTAIDIVCTDSSDRFKILNYCVAFFYRIGIYDKHIHLDWNHNKPQNVIWVGKSS